MTTFIPRNALFAACSTGLLLLTACGGGGGGMVRSDPPPTTAPTPPPPTASSEMCPEPLTADCVADVPATSPTNYLTDGRQSSYALIKRGDGELSLEEGDFRFSGGTSIEDGVLRLGAMGVLQSDITVQTAGRLELFGSVSGHVVNHGDLEIGAIYGEQISAVIEGDYRQSTTGTLGVVLGATTGGTLQISGRADIGGGTLRVSAYTDAWGPYPLPSAPLSHHVLHAGGGVFGQFASWTSPGLFIDGSLRYLSNDIYFDAISISALGVMSAAAVGDAVTLSTASNFDNALNAAGGLATWPAAALTETQRQFLRSAASIQQIGDYDQAVRTFDSLSGHGHMEVANAHIQQAMLSASRSNARISDMRPGSSAGVWSTQPSLVSTSAGIFTQGQTFGYEQWVGERLLLGSSFGWSSGNLQFDRSGGSARSQSPQWNAYLRRHGGNGSYTMGNVGYSHYRLDLDRPIDLGMEMRNAHSERNLDMTHAYVETGRKIHLGAGRLTPFASLRYAALRGDGFIEQGGTGFELVVQPSLHQRIGGDIGLRYARDWRWGADRWMRLDLGARYQHLFSVRDDMRAAFSGTPAVAFDLRGLPQERDDSSLELNLAGGAGDRWSWLLGYDNHAGNETLSLGMELEF